MNGESAFGWIKVIAVVIIAAVLAFILWKGWKEIRALFKKIADFAKFGGGFDASNPISRAVNKPVEYVTGGDTIGTGLAWLFNPTVRAADSINAPVILNRDHSSSYLYGDDNPPTVIQPPNNPSFLDRIGFGA